MPKWAAVILAAGKGTRMKSKLPKVMHHLAGKPMIAHVLDLVTQNRIERSLVVLGHGREQIEEFLVGRTEIVIQEEQLGTGHAVMQALPYLDGVDNIVVLSGDQPLIRTETLAELIRIHNDSKGAATVLTARFENPFGYGRIVKDGTKFIKIVEEKDATLEERAIHEINTGTYCFNVAKLRKALKEITPQNAQGEYYLTEVFDRFTSQGEEIATYCTKDVNEALGINSRVQLAEAEHVLRERILKYWMDEGVTIIDPSSTFIDCEVELSRDVIIEPFTTLKGKTQVAEDAILGPQSTLEDCTCGTGCHVAHSVAKEAQIGPHCNIGPFAYLRPGTVLAEGVKIGDFVEIKNSKIGQGSKVPHLSYVGDSQVGQAVNIGAGTITCNYDGVKKHKTIIGDNVFIGSNTNLVAPVEVGDGAITGAGSTITKDVPAYALAVERSTQKLKENWVRNKK
ncbi:bifunctional UDP-N-acetylglucosamine diphosphorylase/glucosamine-1-phosphate N-acetyltransferase GlmU [Desulfitobacterium sp.]|uniref:bifunctional UDP-N-acetylglucosamine diphosphorylase/glucosamine-1-phosphate N-acetyltransferase GlmU n=1 Tax=Desulfitobacterium sp. TaxID=49981 RepID=UPI002B212D35|nr:bifunctional UDP-N-acetylglucosamine diphosphorylase/glucosamine-1-phosphate N-acetyltransferase GlmU [Desulfitobacterium sp.]MEA4902932.1 bifunctional UDP-N-acetylglucosamine diphosphorylase/glucosamine-1-phosphate N-acetyltransferase GlmU [Desulfitobacterium sp.]